MKVKVLLWPKTTSPSPPPPLPPPFLLFLFLLLKIHTRVSGCIQGWHAATVSQVGHMIAGDTMTPVPLGAPPPALRFSADGRLESWLACGHFQAAGVEDTELKAAAVIRADPEGLRWGG